MAGSDKNDKETDFKGVIAQFPDLVSAALGFDDDTFNKLKKLMPDSMNQLAAAAVDLLTEFNDFLTGTDSSKVEYKDPDWEKVKNQGLPFNRIEGNVAYGLDDVDPWVRQAFKKFSDLFLGNSVQGKTPFGFYSKVNPGVKAYDECKVKKGASVWDDYGYWRCLFPNSAISPEVLKIKDQVYKDEILTKDDLIQACKTDNKDPKSDEIDLGARGYWFTLYKSLLDWKDEKYKKHQSEAEASNRKWHNKEGDDVVISQCSHSKYEPVPKTDKIRWTEVTTDTLADGTTKKVTTIKERPIGQNPPTWTPVDSYET